MATDKSLKQFEKAFNNILQEVAMEMQARIESMYEMSILTFYNQYIPLYYIRTGATFYGSNKYNAGGSFYSNLNRKSNQYMAGILVSSDYIEPRWGGKPYRADTDWVFQRTFEKGIHGNTSSERRKWGYLFKESGKNWNNFNLPNKGKTKPTNWYKDYRFFRNSWKAGNSYYISDRDARTDAIAYFKNKDFFSSKDLTGEQRMYFGNAPLPKRYMASVDKITQTKRVLSNTTDREGNEVATYVNKEYTTYRRKAAPKKKMDKYIKSGNIKNEISKLMLPKLNKLFS